MSATYSFLCSNRRTWSEPGFDTLTCLLRQFDLFLPWTALGAYRAEFIDTPESRLIERCDQFRSHTPQVNQCTLLFEAADYMFIKVVAGKDFCRAKPGLVQNCSRLDAQVGQIA